jgi:alpha-mannosidase
MEPADLLKGSTGCKDKGRVNVGLHLFGHGDGGGGPTSAMLENFRILKNTAGLPKVHKEGRDHETLSHILMF